MRSYKPKNQMNRRHFMQLTAAAVGARSLRASGLRDRETQIRNQRSTMTYRKLGRTDIVASRLVFGCGAALAGGKAVRLLDRALESGINLYDVGSDVAYKGSERSLAPFMKAHRDQIWVVSKAPMRIRAKPDETLTTEQARDAAQQWTRLLDRSLRDLATDYVDGYYLMAVNNPSLVRSEEIYSAFQKARQSGKVGYFGVTTHANAHKVLDAAAETGWYDLAMIAITPGGWYDWDTKKLSAGTPTLLQLQPVLERARKAGVGLVGMKAVRQLAAPSALGAGDPLAYDQYYDQEARAWPLNPYQRSYAYVLKHGLDVVNADMQNFKHLEENLVVVRAGG